MFLNLPGDLTNDPDRRTLILQFAISPNNLKINFDYQLNWKNGIKESKM